MSGLFMSEDWFGFVLFVGALALMGLFAAQFIRGSWQRDRQNRLHLFPRPHVSTPSKPRT